MRNGDRTTYPCVDIQLEESRIPDDAVVKRIRLREYSESEISMLSPPK